MSLYYKVLYQVGFTPWEDDATQGPAAEQIAAPFDRAENDRQPPYGPALDLGCGSGSLRPGRAAGAAKER